MNLSAIILAGGKSTRLGFDKTIIKIKDCSLTELAVKKLEPYANEIFLMSNSNNKFNLKSCIELEDEIQGIGPISPIFTAIKRCSNEYTLLLACDIIGFSPELIDEMKDCITSKEAQAVVLVVNKKKQPLCSIVRTQEARNVLTEIICNEDHSLLQLFNRLNTIYINTDTSLLNINTNYDFIKLKSLYE